MTVTKIKGCIIRGIPVKDKWTFIIEIPAASPIIDNHVSDKLFKDKEKAVSEGVNYVLRKLYK